MEENKMTFPYPCKILGCINKKRNGRCVILTIRNSVGHGTKGCWAYMYPLLKPEVLSTDRELSWDIGWDEHA